MEQIVKEALGLSQSHLVEYKAKQVHQSILKDLTALEKSALMAGFDFEIASGFRDFERQQWIWNNKFQGLRPIKDREGMSVDLNSLSELERIEAIMLFSALPGTSRHHFGTDLDVYSKNCLAQSQSLQLEPWEYESGGPFFEFSAWLTENMEQHGFFRPYDIYRQGVAEEPWHISHRESAAFYTEIVTPEALGLVYSEQNVLGKETIIKHFDYLSKRFISNIST